tara:strand:- start:207 stop:482 length:276 start_codon:yes stop_codon:yes gene_type:complete
MGVEPVHLKLSLDSLSNVVAISGSSSTTAVNIWGEIMDFEAVLVTDSGSSSRPCISSDSDTILKNMVNIIDLKLWMLTLKTTPQMVVPVLV